MSDIMLFLVLLFITPLGWLGMICFGIMIHTIRYSDGETDENNKEDLHE